MHICESVLSYLGMLIHKGMLMYGYVLGMLMCGYVQLQTHARLIPILVPDSLFKEQSWVAEYSTAITLRLEL